MEQKIWVFLLESEVEKVVSDNITVDINAFLGIWDAHGAPVMGQLEILNNMILVISLASKEVIPSGCSKDKLDKSVREICKKHGVPVLDESNLVIKKEDFTLEVLKRAELKRRLNAGELKRDSLILDYSCLGNRDTNLNNIFRPIEETWALTLIN